MNDGKSCDLMWSSNWDKSLCQKRIQQWMETLIDIDYITVSPNADVVNPSLTTTIHVMASVEVFLAEIYRGLFAILDLGSRIGDTVQGLLDKSDAEGARSYKIGLEQDITDIKSST